MPVSVKIDPFSKKPVPPNDLSLRTPQARVLAVLQPKNPDDHQIDWPTCTRYQICLRTGTSTKSMSPNRALNGIPAGSTSGEPHPGLLARGMVEEMVINIDGVTEKIYRITPKGFEALKLFLAANGGRMPGKRNGSVNKRYRNNNEQTEHRPQPDLHS